MFISFGLLAYDHNFNYKGHTTFESRPHSFIIRLSVKIIFFINSSGNEYIHVYLSYDDDD